MINPKTQCILLIQRRDTGEWALPGGFIDNGESTLIAAQREVLEETGVIVAQDEGLIYSGPVNDPRNTKEAWIETAAHLFLTELEEKVAGADDAMDARWHTLSDLPALYGSHAAIVTAALARNQ